MSTDAISTDAKETAAASNFFSFFLGWKWKEEEEKSLESVVVDGERLFGWGRRRRRRGKTMSQCCQMTVARSVDDTYHMALQTCNSGMKKAFFWPSFWFIAGTVGCQFS